MSLLLASIHAPLSSSTLTTSHHPFFAAQCSGVRDKEHWEAYIHRAVQSRPPDRSRGIPPYSSTLGGWCLSKGGCLDTALRQVFWVVLIQGGVLSAFVQGNMPARKVRAVAFGPLDALMREQRDRWSWPKQDQIPIPHGTCYH